MTASSPHPELPGRPCSVAATLALVGEKWALLAVREISLGNHRFDAIARNTGAPRDRLASRLRALEAVGVVERRQYHEHPPRFEYHLTPAGADLRVVLQALRAWGDRWAVDAPPTSFRHAGCEAGAHEGGGRKGNEQVGAEVDAEVDVVLVCRACGERVAPEDVRARVRTPGWTRTGPAPA